MKFEEIPIDLEPEGVVVNGMFFMEERQQESS